MRFVLFILCYCEKIAMTFSLFLKVRILSSCCSNKGISTVGSEGFGDIDGCLFYSLYWKGAKQYS